MPETKTPSLLGALAQTAKDAIKKRLPVEAERVLALSGKVQRRCGTCSSFDLAAGQQSRQNDPVISAVTAALSPAHMSAAQRKTLKVNPEDGGLEADREVVEDRIETWADFGACMKYKELVDQHRTKGAGDVDKDISPCPSWS